MLHERYLHKGANVELPELSGYVPAGPTKFLVRGIYAGGMGMCVHLRHMSSASEYALKGVRPDLIEKGSTIERFLGELQVWLSASSCNLIAEAVAVININETPCVLAPWMVNGDLCNALPSLNKIEKFETLLRTVRGLHWVNTNLGVIHRDLKPANVLLDTQRLSYITDWGLARPTGKLIKHLGSERDTQSQQLPDKTAAGSFIGTMTYAAPEQIMGSESIDHRADIYALGCMMYEFETGTPPFLGETAHEIARKHVQDKPKKLGGWFKTTELGLELIIARCLEKNAYARYGTYEELESELLGVASRHQIRLERCNIGTRYTRTVLGQGFSQQESHIRRTPIRSAKYALVEAAQIEPFLEEAVNLMAVNRFSEAENLLRPYLIPDAVGGDKWWPSHSIALNYGVCLIKLGRATDAAVVFKSLAHAIPKPSEYFVNYSLAMLHKGGWDFAVGICEEGLLNFPNDPDIQGNLTIALMCKGDFRAAHESALQRIGIRRDIHALDESAGLLIRQAIELRNQDLPSAIEIAKVAGDLINEGKRLNPRYFLLHLKELSLRRFAYDEKVLITLAQSMIDNDDCYSNLRQVAFAEMVEQLSEGKAFEAALDLIKKGKQGSSLRIKTAKLRTLARRRMLGKHLPDGRRVVIAEVCDFFLAEAEPGCYPDPVLAAEIKEWLGEDKTAVTILEAHISKNPNDWDGIKLMAMIYLRLGYFNRAVQISQLLVKRAPWRAESYDLVAHIAGETGRDELVTSAKMQGDEIFKQEDRLYTELRLYLDDLNMQA